MRASLWAALFLLIDFAIMAFGAGEWADLRQESNRALEKHEETRR